MTVKSNWERTGASVVSAAENWAIWLAKIEEYCESGRTDCYAEKALNEISGECAVYAFDVGNRLCSEIDTPEDLAVVSAKLREIENRTVYMCFSTDILHGGHIAIIRKAQKQTLSTF